MLPVISGAAAIVVLILLIVKLKLHPFIALMISSIILGLVNGLASPRASARSPRASAISCRSPVS